MTKLVINGGKTLRGIHTSPGNKNAALPMLAASLLTDKPVHLRNLPLIEDVFTMLDIMSDTGADVRLRGRTVTVSAAGLSRTRLNRSLCSSVRSSILFAGPLAARHGSAVLFPPGGDVIGRRRLDTHFEGLSALGIVPAGRKRFTFERRRLHGADILLDEASVTATENIIMAASIAPGTTTIYNAACEPHVQALCRMLNSMGANIGGIGTNRLKIRGVKTLKGCTCAIPPDYVDAASFLAAGALTGGAVTVKNAAWRDMEIVMRHLSKTGLKAVKKKKGLAVSSKGKLSVTDDLGSAIPKIEDGPWPSFPSDLMSAAIVLATRAEGTVLFFEKMFESRMYFVDRLIHMGARIVQCDPHRVIVSGPSTLRGIHMSSPDIRAGMALILAALSAEKQSVIDNVQIIDRGYENVGAELQRLGADISVIQ
ncbi:MAG: UDP-N-acetylglucosamine 1-carboxyvinyltransferase [Kiritimatiellia bacterium]